MRGSSHSLLDAVEAAYRDERDQQKWLAGLAAAATAPFPTRIGASAFTFRVDPRRGVEMTAMAYVGPPEGERGMESMNHVDSAITRALFSRGFTCGSLSQLMGPSYRQHATVKRHMFANGIADSVGFTLRDVTGRGLTVTAAMPEEARLSRALIARYSLVAAHVAAAQRLRDQETGTGDVFTCAEAVLSPTGKLHHAETAAQSRLAREALRTAAVALERARGRRRDEGEALRFWRALVAGRWSLVDHFDRDGRRFFLARRNDARLSQAPALSLKERQAAAYAALGHSNKLIGYYLGISPTAVATRLARAAQKLGARSRAELSELWRTFEES